MVKLRPYQEDVLNKIETTLQTKNDVVIAACPSSGKTTIALEYIKRTNHKVLIITHGQTILRDMWASEIAKYLTEEEQARVIFGLPQTLKNKQIPKVDLIIVDEAHEFTFASMVQTILQKNKSAKKIYLTGTPSKFIEKKYDVIITPAVDLITQGYISDLYVGVFSTKADIRNMDRNTENNDLLEESVAKLVKTVNSDMDSLLESLVRRLKSSGFTKSNPLLAKATDWSIALGNLHKTMIACASVKQAEKVLKYLHNKNINAISSNSVNDPNSENIQKFQDDVDIKVLVVVDRAILGFNMPDLVNVVDMTCSHNINRIYQLYARVMRKNDNYKHKYFFKLSPVNEMQVAKFYMEASLCLMFEYFISKYNGKNLDKSKIPARVTTKRTTKPGSKNGIKTVRTLSVDKDLFETVSAAKILVNIFNNIDNPLNEHAMVTFGEIRRDVFGEDLGIDWKDAKEVLKYLKEEFGDARV